jgi:O-antigen/teichoic acid export membrane protein
MTIEEYATYGVFSASLVLLTFIIHYGVVSTFSRHFFLYKSIEERKIYTGQIILLHLVTAVTFAGIFYFGKDYLLKEVFSAFSNQHYYYLLCTAFFSFMSALYSVYLRVTEKPKKFILFQLTTVVLYASLMFLFQLVQYDVLNSVLLALLVTGAVMWGVSLIGLQYKFSLLNIVKTIKATVAFSTPIFLGYMMYFCLNKFNVLYLQHHVDKESLAFFNFALQLSTIVALLAASAGKAIHPALFKLKESEVIIASVRIAVYYKRIMFIMILLLLGFSKYLILLFAPPEFLASEDVLRILLISAFIYNLRSVESSLFFYFHKPKYSFYITTISAVIVVVLSISLVAKMGIIASAYSIFAGSCFAFLGNKYYYRVLIKDKYSEVTHSKKPKVY